MIVQMAGRCLVAILLHAAFGLAALSASQDVAGNYKGIIWSNSDRPGITTIRVSATGKITGTYTFQDARGAENGRLLDCKLSGQKLTCTWEDIYGTGDWYALFTTSYKSFRGGWFDKPGDLKRYGVKHGYRWDGARQ